MSACAPRRVLFTSSYPQGDTLFYSTYAHYDKLSEPMKEMLAGLTARHSGSMFREQSRRFGYNLHLGPRGAPENVGDEFEASRECRVRPL